jgi:Phycobilisome degradation protein nblA
MKQQHYSVSLTLEQEFNIRSFAEQVKKLSLEKAQAYLVQLYRQLIIKETMYKQFFVDDWGMLTPKYDSPESSSIPEEQ